MTGLVMALICFALSALNVALYAADGGTLNLAAAVFCGLCGVANAIIGATSL